MQNKIQELRERSGSGMMICNKAIELCQGNVNVAYEFVKLKGQAVCRRKANGERWTDEDYLSEAKKIAKEVT